MKRQNKIPPDEKTNEKRPGKNDFAPDETIIKKNEKKTRKKRFCSGRNNHKKERSQGQGRQSKRYREPTTKRRK